MHQGQCAFVDDSEISQLISKPKRISDPPSKTWREKPFQRRKDFRLEAIDGSGKFRAFARQSSMYPENFSIGLEFEPENGDDSMILIRCNGPHGDFNNRVNPEHHHFHPHVHRASSAALEKNERAEKYAIRTDQFVTFEQAMRFFLEIINLDPEDKVRFFQEDLQRNLFEGLEKSI